MIPILQAWVGNTSIGTYWSDPIIKLQIQYV
jgi:hypothetical protein